jgi:hypothetical protein
MAETNQQKLARLNAKLLKLVGTSADGRKFVDGGMFGVEQVAEILRAISLITTAQTVSFGEDISNVVLAIDPGSGGEIPPPGGGGPPLQVDAKNVVYNPTEDKVTDLENVQDAMVDHADSIEQRVVAATGVISGGLVTQDSPTTFSVAFGEGEIINTYDDVDNAAINEVTWVTQGPLAVADSGNNIAFIKVYIDANGVVFQSIASVVFSDLRDKILLAVVSTVNNSIVDITNSPAIIGQTQYEVKDVLLNDVKLSGSRTFPVNAVLSVYIEQGSIFFPGANWYTDNTNPNLLPLPQVGDENTPVSFKIMYKDGSIEPGDFTVIPEMVNDGAGNIVSNINGNSATIHRLYSLGFGAGRTFVLLYGQNEYNNATVALDRNLLDDSITTFPPETSDMFFISKICVAGNASSFDDATRAWIISDDQDGLSSGGSTSFDRFFDGDLTLTEEDCGFNWIYRGTGTATLTLPLISAYAGASCLFRVSNLSTDAALLTVALQVPDTFQDNNAEVTGLLTIPIYLGMNRLILWQTPNLYYTFLLDWHLNLFGDFIPDTNGFQNIGDKDTGPKFIAFHEPATGIKGLMIALDTSLSHLLPYLTMMGSNVAVIGEPIPIISNAPVVLWGQPIMFKTDSGVLWGFGAQGAIPPESIRNHHMIFGSIQDTQDGDQFAQVEIGPAVQYLNVENVTSNAQFDVTDNSTIILTLSIVAAFVDPSAIHWEVHILESGLRDTLFDIRVKRNGVDIYTHPLIPLQGSDQLVSFTFPIDPADFPMDNTVDLTLVVEGISTNPNSAGFVRGDLSPSVLEIRQEPAAAAAFRGLEINLASAIDDYRNAYRITTAGTYPLDESFNWESKGIDTIVVKNASSGVIVLETSGTDVIDAGFGLSALTSIDLIPGDSVLLSIITQGIWEIISPDIKHRHHYVQAGLPFTTTSIVYVVAASEVTPTMVLSSYKLDIYGTISIDAANRRVRYRILVDGVPISPEWEFEPADAINNIPFGYSFIVDWTAANATHSITLEVLKAGGGGVAEVSVNDFRYQLDRWDRN